MFLLTLFCISLYRGEKMATFEEFKEFIKDKQFLKENGEIYFKTDDDNLFNDSISYFKSSGFEIIKNTYDLQDEPEFWENIKTEHEDMFTEQGIKIKALIARVITN